jgi:hypothetical protein
MKPLNTIRSISDLFRDALVTLGEYWIQGTRDEVEIVREVELVASRLEPFQTPPMPSKPPGTAFQGLTFPRVSDEQIAEWGLTPDVLQRLAENTDGSLTPSALRILAQTESAGAPDSQNKRLRAALGKLPFIPTKLKKR